MHTYQRVYPRYLANARLVPNAELPTVLVLDSAASLVSSHVTGHRALFSPLQAGKCPSFHPARPAGRRLRVGARDFRRRRRQMSFSRFSPLPSGFCEPAMSAETSLVMGHAMMVQRGIAMTSPAWQCRILSQMNRQCQCPCCPPSKVAAAPREEFVALSDLQTAVRVCCPRL